MSANELAKLLVGLIKIDDCLKNYHIYFSYGVRPGRLIVSLYRGESLIEPFKTYHIDLDDNEQSEICMNELNAMAKEVAHESI